MLILEGPDGAGKTSLAIRLQRDLKLPISAKVVGSDTVATVDLARWTEENIAKGFQQMIFDRHRLISEPIYGPVLRGHQDPRFLDMGWMSDMTWRFYAANPVIIYCMPPFDVVLRNVQDPSVDNKKVNDPQVMEALYAGYISRATQDFSRGVGRLYNYKTTLYSDLKRWVELQMEKSYERAVGGRILPHTQQAG